MPKSKIQKLILSQLSKNEQENKIIYNFNISNGESIAVEIKKLLTADEMDNMVVAIVNSLFDSNVYHASIKDLIISKAIVLYYTNIKDNISNEDLINIIYNTTIIDTIISKINIKQFNVLQSAIDDLIEYRKADINSAQVKRLNEITTSLDLYLNIIKTVTEQYENIDIKDLIDSVKSMTKISDESLVNNILSHRDAKNKENDNV